jgi:hypothetical protein
VVHINLLSLTDMWSGKITPEQSASILEGMHTHMRESYCKFEFLVVPIENIFNRTSVFDTCDDNVVRMHKLFASLKTMDDKDDMLKFLRYF